MKDEYQQELFDEFKKDEGSLKRLSKKIMPERRPRILHLTLESIVSVSILVILGFIIFFALGVEKGKRQVKFAMQESEVVETKVDAYSEPEKELPKVQPVQSRVITDTSRPYTIQLISYDNRNKAQAKANEIKSKEGLDAIVVQKNKWYQVCVGSYIDRKDAEADLKKFSKEYKGCFLRNRNTD